jgi:chemotaxis methyl-accepting protein methylase
MKQLEEVKSHLRARWGLRWSDDFARQARQSLEKSASNSLEVSLCLLNGETYFFRYPLYMQVLREHLRRTLARGTRHYRVLSAGCSSGEEAYSVAFALQEECRLLGGRLEVIGLDARPEAIKKAHSARYRDWSLRDRDAADVELYLSRVENGWEVKPQYRKHVRFQVQNLLEPFALERVHAALSCNVLLYMHEDAVAAVYRNLDAVLEDQGLLMVAPTDPAPPAPWRLLPEGSGWPVFTRQAPEEPASHGKLKAAARGRRPRKPAPARKPAASAAAIPPGTGVEPEALTEFSDNDLWQAWARGELRAASEHVRRKLFFEPEHPLWRFLSGVILWENGWLRKSAAEIRRAGELLASRQPHEMIGALCTVEELQRVIDFWRQQHG